jgi:hypothetical protein
MWILSFIPDSFLIWVINIIIAAGAVAVVAGFFLKFIPFVYRWSSIFQILGIILLVSGVYFKGGYDTEMGWRAKAAELNAQVERIKAESASASKKIVYKYIERTKIVKEKSNAIKSKIPEYVNKEADANCTIPESAIVLHDAAAKNELPDPAAGAVKRASGVTLSKLLDTTVVNYGTFYEVREQLKALQDWVREQQKINP